MTEPETEKRAAPSLVLLLHAFFLHLVIMVLLPPVKFAGLRKWVFRWMYTPQATGDSLIIARAVRRSSRWVPGSTCLSEALCCYGEMLKHGFRPKLMIGIEKRQSGKLDAHAWIELNNKVIFGDNGRLDRYKVMKKKRKKSS